jgi:hypothetical protein
LLGTRSLSKGSAPVLGGAEPTWILDAGFLARTKAGLGSALEACAEVAGAGAAADTCAFSIVEEDVLEGSMSEAEESGAGVIPAEVAMAGVAVAETPEDPPESAFRTATSTAEEPEEDILEDKTGAKTAPVVARKIIQRDVQGTIIRRTDRIKVTYSKMQKSVL